MRNIVRKSAYNLIEYNLNPAISWNLLSTLVHAVVQMSILTPLFQLLQYPLLDEYKFIQR